MPEKKGATKKASSAAGSAKNSKQAKKPAAAKEKTSAPAADTAQRQPRRREIQFVSLLLEESETLIGSRCSHLNPVFPRQLFLNHPLISLFAAPNFCILCCFCTFTTFTPTHKRILEMDARNPKPME